MLLLFDALPNWTLGKTEMHIDGAAKNILARELNARYWRNKSI